MRGDLQMEGFTPSASDDELCFRVTQKWHRPKNVSFRTLIACLALMSSTAHSQTITGPPEEAGSITTLADALATAYRTNPMLGVSRYNLRALDEGYVQARAEQRLSLQVQVLQGNGQVAAVDPRANLDGALVAEQPIYSGGRTSADIGAAAAAVRAGREAVRATEGDTLLAVITSYVDVRRDERSLAIRRDDLTVLSSLVREISARREAGELTATDVAQAETQIHIAEAQAIDAEAQLEASRATFAALVGDVPGRLAPEPPLPGVPPSIGSALRLADISSPDVAQARETAQSSGERVDAARASRRPTLSYRLTLDVAGRTDPLLPRTDHPEMIGQLALNVPLFSGGRLASQVRQAEDQNAADRLRVEQARRTVTQTVLQAWNADVAARRSRDTQTDQLAASRTLLEGTLAEYRLGLRSTFDVLNAEQNLRDTLLSLIVSEHDAYVAEATLLRRVGFLEVTPLMTGVPHDDPIAKFKEVERRDRLPWDGVFALLDSAARPHFRPRPVTAPPPAVDPKISQSAGSHPRTFAHAVAATPDPSLRLDDRHR